MGKQELNVEKLPKFVRKYIEQLQADNATLRDQLKKFADTQTPSPFSYEVYISDSGGTGFHKAFIQSSNVQCAHAGVQVELRPSLEGVDITFNEIDRMGVACIRPQATNRITVMTRGEK